MLATEPLGALEGATDWRAPEHRREVFHDFYEFHTRYGIHPGCVYFLIPWLRSHFDWDDEQTLWFAFLNGNTQNPLTTLLLHRRGSRPAEADAMLAWYDEHVAELAWDTDRRYHRKALAASVRGYLELIGDEPQFDFWHRVAEGGWPALWRTVNLIPTFARLSGWSYCDYLHICGVPTHCNDLMLEDRAGSRSHRNGLCIVGGLDVYDWHQSNPTFSGRYPRVLLNHLAQLGHGLWSEAVQRAAGRPWLRDVTYLTLESALCTYKSWHRPNRRYPGVYVDMLYERIRQAEQRFPDDGLEVFWRAREDCLPRWLLVEFNPGDPGLHPLKTNHYRLTGEVPVMGHEYPRYWSAFDDAVRARLLGTFR